jgi:hypothetical protein
MAYILKAPPEPFCELWAALFKEAILSVFPTTAAQLKYVCLELGVAISQPQTEQAAKIMYDYEAATMTRHSEAVEVLRGLKSRGLKLCLITKFGGGPCGMA